MSFEFEFSEEQLSEIIPTAVGGVSSWYTGLVEILPTYDITSILRIAGFLSQTAHESGGYRVLKENLNYSSDALNKIFPKYFKNAGRDALEYHRQQEKIANVIYADRMGNGNTKSGDGWKFRGRGLIQLTGRNNYTAFSDSINMDIDAVPEYLETPKGAIHSACWFWNSVNLNKLADVSDIIGMTKRINGGVNGLDDRIKHYNHALEVLRR